MIMGFMIWSICSVIFLGIGISARKAEKPTGFFTFAEPPKVTDVKGYNNAVSKIWFIAAVILELIGIPFLFFEQNSPIFLLMIFAVFILLILMILAYLKIERTYKK